MWELWCKSIGQKAYDDKCKADKVALVRSAWILLHITTCLFIILTDMAVKLLASTSIE